MVALTLTILGLLAQSALGAQPEFTVRVEQVIQGTRIIEAVKFGTDRVSYIRNGNLLCVETGSIRLGTLETAYTDSYKLDRDELGQFLFRHTGRMIPQTVSMGEAPRFFLGSHLVTDEQVVANRIRSLFLSACRDPSFQLKRGVVVRSSLGPEGLFVQVTQRKLPAESKEPIPRCDRIGAGWRCEVPGYGSLFSRVR
jgi:hypothetical protein